MVACGLDLVGVDPLPVAPEAGVPSDGALDATTRDVVEPISEAGGDVISEAGGDVIVPTDGGADADSGLAVEDASDADAGDAAGASDASDAGDSGGPPITTDVNGCPKGRGPDMAKSGKLCIDRTEVTRAQYAEFLAHDRPDSADAGAVPECKKASHTPSAWPPASGPDTVPVVYVDWCDADAFCRWSGKGLCGAPDGNVLATDPGHLNSGTKDAWYAACSTDGANAYPYGSTYMSAFCNLGAAGPSPADGGANANCTGGYAGLTDMLGNVWEHANACAGNACIARGASFRTASSSTTTCKNTIDVLRTDRFDDLGIRCCKTLP